MQTTARHKPRPVIEAERRAEAAHRRAGAAETVATREQAETGRLAAALDDMRQERDRWRAQAERLAAALEQLKAPVERVEVVGPADAGQADTLSGYAEIGQHLGMSEREAKHLGSMGAIPTFKLPGSRIVRARRSSLTAFLAAQEGR